MALITKGAVDRLIELTLSNTVRKSDLELLRSDVAAQLTSSNNKIAAETAARKALTSVMSYKADTIEVVSESGGTTQYEATFSIPNDTHGIILPYGMVLGRSGSSQVYTAMDIDGWYDLEEATSGITFEIGQMDVEEFYIWALIVRSQY